MQKRMTASQTLGKVKNKGYKVLIIAKENEIWGLKIKLEHEPKLAWFGPSQNFGDLILTGSQQIVNKNES